MEKRARIALIEADDLIRQLAARWLASARYRVHCVTIPALANLGADLLIVDISNPRRLGTLMRALRAAHAAPVLLVSARFHRSSEPAVELAAQLGVAAVLAKPYSKDELLAAVEAALQDPA